MTHAIQSPGSRTGTASIQKKNKLEVPVRILYNNNMMNKKYILLERGKKVPMTTCDTIEEMIVCVRAFEHEWRMVQIHMGRSHDASPYTIGQEVA